MARRLPPSPPPSLPVPLLEQSPPPPEFGDMMERLRQRYLPTLPPPRKFEEPLNGVIRVILAQQNTRRVAQGQWEALRHTYPQWEAAYLDGPDGIQATLKQAGGGLTRIKADYICGVLDALEQGEHGLSLRHLRGLSDADCRRELEALPGVGQTTAALVMLFDLLRPALPVEGNITRWARRLGLVPERWSAGKVAQWFEQAAPYDWETRYALHISGVRHGHETCKSQRPLCGECVLLEFCPSAGILMGGEEEALKR